jgi:tetratricopeptide (TPR) repeat protein
MPIQAHMDVGPAVQPARCRLLTPDASGSALGQKSGWWCEGRGMLWENYKAEGKTAVERGQYAEAENFFHAAIEQAEQVGSFNPRLADSLNELAILYAKQHKYAQAELMFQRSLGVSVAALGSDHPDVAIVLKNIGIMKASQRQYAEADLLLSQSLSLARRVLGHEHPIVAVTMRTIAVFQAIQGHYGEAERFIRRSLEIGEKVLGSEHPEMAASRKVFAQVFRPVLRDTEVHRPESEAQDIRTRSACGN